jgi:hypothetical protein
MYLTLKSSEFPKALLPRVVKLENLTLRNGKDRKNEKSTLEKLTCSIMSISMELITRSAKGFLNTTGSEKPNRTKNKKAKVEYL